MLIRRVVDDELGEHADVARVRFVDEAAEVVERSVDRVDRRVVRDVIPIVFERRGIKGKQPQAVDAEVLEIRQLLRQAGEIADPVAIAVVESTYVYFVDECVFVPKGVHITSTTGSRLPAPGRRRCAPRAPTDRASRNSILRATGSELRRAGLRRCTGRANQFPSPRSASAPIPAGSSADRCWLRRRPVRIVRVVLRLT